MSAPHRYKRRMLTPRSPDWSVEEDLFLLEQRALPDPPYFKEVAEMLTVKFGNKRSKSATIAHYSRLQEQTKGVSEEQMTHRWVQPKARKPRDHLKVAAPVKPRRAVDRHYRGNFEL